MTLPSMTEHPGPAMTMASESGPRGPENSTFGMTSPRKRAAPDGFGRPCTLACAHIRIRTVPSHVSIHGRGTRQAQHEDPRPYQFDRVHVRQDSRVDALAVRLAQDARHEGSEMPAAHLLTVLQVDVTGRQVPVEGCASASRCVGNIPHPQVQNRSGAVPPRMASPRGDAPIACP